MSRDCSHSPSREPSPSVSSVASKSAAQLAQCGDILGKTPGGLDAVIGAKGVYLSGGEMQRIALARDIYDIQMRSDDRALVEEGGNA